jgi:phosphate starvation-inducible membrane PsiE
MCQVTNKGTLYLRIVTGKAGASFLSRAAIRVSKQNTQWALVAPVMIYCIYYDFLSNPILLLKE